MRTVFGKIATGQTEVDQIEYVRVGVTNEDVFELDVIVDKV